MPEHNSLDPASCFQATVRVPWADTDAAGIVWFGNFLRYLEYAEEEIFRVHGRSRLSLRENLGIDMPRTQLTISYRSPARFDDILQVGLRVESIQSRRIRFGFRIGLLSRIVAEGQYEIACVDRSTFSGRAFPPEIVDVLTAVRERLQSPIADASGPVP